VGPALRSIVAVLLLLDLACAHILAPPGGPVDKTPPQLLAIYPESLGVYPDFKGDVEFQFDEVLSEGSTPSIGLGTGDLEKLVIVSPTREVPKVGWKRTRVTVRPREGWKPGRVYRVQLLPGVADVSRNRTDSGVVVTFTTGASLPTATLRGRVVDWVNHKAGAAALIEAVLAPDSLIYRTYADSGGRYALTPIPQGSYLVFASIDQNRNQRRDYRESFDSVRAPPDTGAVPNLWMFPHDTLAPRIQNVAAADSVSAIIQFSQMLDPAKRPDTAAIRLRILPDSVPVAVLALMPPTLYDSLKAAARARADTTRPADTTKAIRPRPIPLPRPMPHAKAAPDTVGLGQLLAERPQPYDKLVVEVQQPWVPGTKYLVEVHGVSNLSGASGDASGVLAVPVPPKVPADTTKAQRDSTAKGPGTPADTTKAVRDSTAKPPSPQ
jgi:hypothetical protein